jgi:hypothetical protein
LIAPHYKQTKNRILASKAKYILAIQDQMRLNFTSHKAKSDLGVIGKLGKTTQYGLIQHSALCITDQNEPLGLIDVEYFDYSDFDTSISRDKRAIEDKANIFWIDALKRMKERLGDTQKRIITVADREGDFYEFLHALLERDEEFVIRSQHNRIMGEIYQKRGEKLRELLEDTPDIGNVDVTLQDVNSREIKEMRLNLKVAEVTFPPPKKSRQPNKKRTTIKRSRSTWWLLITKNTNGFY